ncbi:hypothetical protein H5410_014858 [Solanum commersonii]|uniref:Uncharacterized protein n=1 Tax=Solanum commersonii TaxID=4109 RepID=A0A9J5ZSM5_SOLCO|nr:hypothetical protein H5410_014858 [Solanum commersonii]
MKEEMKHEMREEMREELCEEMKDEMQQEMQEEVDKILQERLPILIAGLPKPPHGTPPSGTPHYLRHDSSSNKNMGNLKFPNDLRQIFYCLFPYLD